MISMRYAKNLANGHGPVWNIGEEPVEGFTNPMWVAFMAFFHLFPFPISKISLAIQISGALFLTLNLLFVFKIVKLLTRNPVVPLLAVVLTAFYMPLNNWGMQGMEVSILLLITNVVIWMVLNNLEGEIPYSRLYLILGFSTLIRIDMAIPYLVILGFLQFFGNPGDRSKNIIVGISILIASLLIQTTLRFWYYGDLLPNTYYLKMGGFPLVLRLRRGFYTFYEFVKQMGMILLIFPIVLVILRRDRRLVLLSLIIIGQIAYSIYVGGDAWEHKVGSNRYISIAMPTFFMLYALAIESFLQKLIQAKSQSKLIKFLPNLLIIAISLASVARFNKFLSYRRAIEFILLLRQPPLVEGNKEYLQIANALNNFTTPEAKIAVVSAGAIPYFTQRSSIDLLGKNDPVIAHQPNHFPNKIKNIRPGHMKWDYDYSIGQLKPDVVVQLWGDSQKAEEYLNNYYSIVEYDSMLFSVRTESQNIIWNRVRITH